MVLGMGIMAFGAASADGVLTWAELAAVVVAGAGGGFFAVAFRERVAPGVGVSVDAAERAWEAAEAADSPAKRAWAAAVARSLAAEAAMYADPSPANEDAAEDARMAEAGAWAKWRAEVHPRPAFVEVGDPALDAVRVEVAA